MDISGRPGPRGGVASIASVDDLAAEPPADAASAPRLPAALAACARTRIDAERLACYDQLVSPQLRGAAEAPGAAASAPATAGQVSADRPAPLASDDGLPCTRQRG